MPFRSKPASRGLTITPNSQPGEDYQVTPAFAPCTIVNIYSTIYRSCYVIISVYPGAGSNGLNRRYMGAGASLVQKNFAWRNPAETGSNHCGRLPVMLSIPWPLPFRPVPRLRAKTLNAAESEGNTWCRLFEKSEWKMASEEFFEVDRENPHSFTFLEFVRDSC